MHLKWCILFGQPVVIWLGIPCSLSPEVSTEIGSTGGIGDSLGMEVVSSSHLLSWGIVRGHSTIGVGNQGSSWDWEADGWNSKAIAQPRLSLSITLLLAGTWDGNVSCVHAWGRLKAIAPSSKTVAQPGLSFSLTLPETMSKTKIGSTGGVGDSLGMEVVSSSHLLSWGIVRGHSTIGVGNQGSSWDWEADSGDSKAIAQPRLSLSRNGGNQAGQSSSKSLHCRWCDCCCLPKS